MARIYERVDPEERSTQLVSKIQFEFISFAVPLQREFGS